MVYSRSAQIAAAAGLVLLAGCAKDELQRSFGLTRDAPDEFVVTTRAPLSLPPDFSLRPPQPGAARPQEVGTQQAAEDALVPQSALVPTPTLGSGDSAGQEALIAAAGPPAPPDIRNRVNQEAAKEASDSSLTDRLMFWKTPKPPGTVVDPQKEAQRLRDNAALGKSQTIGDTPIIQTKPKTLFDELF